MRRMLVLTALLLAACGVASPSSRREAGGGAPWARPPSDARPPAESSPSGTLYFAGRAPGTVIRVDTAAGTVTERTGLREMGGGDSQYMVHFTGGRLVTFALGRSTSFAPDVTRPRSLGEAWFYVPSATPGRVWNILLRRGDPATQVNFRGVREMTVDGRPTFARHVAVPGWPVGAVPTGLLLQRRKLRVWDPRTARVVRRLKGEFPVGVRGPLVASFEYRARRLHLTDTGTGRDVVVRGARVIDSYEGAFSPDGRYLATLATRGRIALVDVAAGTAQIIPGARTAKDYKLLAWASSGWLFYNAGDGRLGAWKPGERARLLGVKVGPFIDMTAD